MYLPPIPENRDIMFVVSHYGQCTGYYSRQAMMAQLGIKSPARTNPNGDPIIRLTLTHTNFSSRPTTGHPAELSSPRENDRSQFQQIPTVFDKQVFFF